MTTCRKNGKRYSSSGFLPYHRYVSLSQTIALPSSHSDVSAFILILSSELSLIEDRGQYCLVTGREKAFLL